MISRVRKDSLQVDLRRTISNFSSQVENEQEGGTQPSFLSQADQQAAAQCSSSLWVSNNAKGKETQHTQEKLDKKKERKREHNN